MCNGSYIREISRRLETRVDEQGGKDKNSKVYKHTVAQKYTTVSLNDVEILSKNTNVKSMSRKALISLFIQSIQPSLNMQEQSVSLKLFQHT